MNWQYVLDQIRNARWAVQSIISVAQNNKGNGFDTATMQHYVELRDKLDAEIEWALKQAESSM